MPADPAKVAAALAKSAATVEKGLVDPEFDRQAIRAQQDADAAAIGDAQGTDEDVDAVDYDPDDIEAREAALDRQSVEPVVLDAQPKAADAAPTAPTFSAEQLQQLAQAEYVNNLLANDPAAVAKYAFDRLTPEQKAAILGTPPTPEVDPYALSPDDLATLTVAERIAYDHRRTIIDAPKRFATVEQQIQQQRQQAQDNFTYRDYQLERQSVLIHALAEALDIQLPDVPDSEVDNVMRSGKSMKDAVGMTLGKKLRDAVALKKAQGKPTPRTPSSVGGRSDMREPLADNASLLDQMLFERGLEPTPDLVNRVRNYKANAGRR